MLNGGLVAGRPYAVIGPPGAGKSLLGWQFLLEGARKGEKTLYITIDEPHYEIRSNMQELGLDNPQIKIMDISPEDMGNEGSITPLSFFDRELPRQIDKLRPVRVVLDSTTSLRSLSDDDVSARRRILSLMRTLSEKEEEDKAHPPITSLLIIEETGERFPSETYLARGVIRLFNTMDGSKRIRGVLVEKMRGSGFDESVRPLRISDKGLLIGERDSMIYDP